MPYTIGHNLLMRINEIKAAAEAAARAKEADELAAGKKLFDGPKAAMLAWPSPEPPPWALNKGGARESFFLARPDASGSTELYFPRGETTYFTARRLWDAYAPVKELILADGASEEAFFQFGPTLFPWTYGVLTLARYPDVRGDPNILVGIRSKELAGRHVGTVSFPGGLVNPGETLEQAARRQMREECGIEIGSLSPVLAMGNHPNAGSTTFMCVANANASATDVTDSFEWKGGKAIWVPERDVIKALEGDSKAMAEAFHRAGLDVEEGAPIAPDAAAPAKRILIGIGGI